MEHRIVPDLAALGLLALVLLLQSTAPAAPMGVTAIGKPSAPENGEIFRDCSDCPDMVVIPAGAYIAGGNRSEQEREHVPAELAAGELPAHAVTIAYPMAIGRYEVTRGEFSAFVAATRRVEPWGCSVLDIVSNSWGEEPLRRRMDPGFAQTDDHPVICVSLGDALDYVRWLSAVTGRGYRLPSEGEWEYAARAGSRAARFWGDGRDAACANANVADLTLADALGTKAGDSEVHFQCRDGYAFTAPVGSFRPNAFGLYDINGNVWEWTADCYNVTLEGAPGDGSARGDGDCAGHMDRGGSWVNSPKYLRTAARHKDVTTIRNTVLGFRVVRDID